jgi:hypothetical protein
VAPVICLPATLHNLAGSARTGQTNDQRQIAPNGTMSRELVAEVRRLLAQILIADYRDDLKRLAGATVTSPEGQDRG